MPIHDWTRVGAGTWHDFHLAWISELRSSLNGGLLPADYYALAEQFIGPFGPDVLTLQEVVREDRAIDSPSGGVAVKAQPPSTRLTVQADYTDELPRQRTLSIRHASDDRIVALVELLSPGNKSTQHAVEVFVDKAIATLCRGYHLLIIDLFPPTVRDPNGIHGEIWKVLDKDTFRLSPAEPLLQAAYSAGPTKTAYVEPTAVGQKLIDMPLFLTAERYVPVPLQATYDRAYAGLPQRWKRVLEGDVAEQSRTSL